MATKQTPSKRGEKVKNDCDLHDEIHDTWTVLSHTYRLMSKLWNLELSTYGFSREQALSLMIIKCLGDNATPYRISRFQAQEHNTVSDILNRMEKQNLITKVRESNGKSRVKIRLTERGEQAYAQSIERDILTKKMSVLSKDKLKRLRLTLEILRDEILKEFEKDQIWPEIRVPPSQWTKSELFKKTSQCKSINATKSVVNNTKRSKRKTKSTKA